MKIIFSPTKIMDVSLNDYNNTIPNNLEITNEINNKFNVMIKEDSNQAIFFYNGTSFKYLDPKTLSINDINFLQDNLIILSALYGALKPLDLINRYRLDFTNKELYKYWNIDFNDELIINLASKEYSKLVKSNNMITIDFKQLIDNKLVTKGMYSKMLRGLFLRYITVNKITNIEDLKNFSYNGYIYDSLNSSNNYFLFVKEI